MGFERNPENVFGLEDGQVFVNFGEETPKIGKNGTFGKGWHTVGILADGLNFNGTRSLEETTTSGGGFGVVHRANKPGDLTMSYEVLEDNAVNRRVAWPEQSTKDGVTVLAHTGKVTKAWVAFVMIGDNGTVCIRATRQRANLKMENIGRNENPEGREVNVGVIPDTDKSVIEERWFKVEGDGLVEFTPKIFVEDSEVENSGEEGTDFAKVVAGKATELDEEKIEEGK